MALVTSTHALRIGADPKPASERPVPAVVPHATKHIPKPRAVQRPRAMAKAVSNVAGVDHYKPRG